MPIKIVESVVYLESPRASFTWRI